MIMITSGGAVNSEDDKYSYYDIFDIGCDDEGNCKAGSGENGINIIG